MTDISSTEIAIILGTLAFVFYVWRLPTRRRRPRPGRGHDHSPTGAWFDNGGDFGDGDCGGGGGD
ncbi:hypothetical protein [Ruegeria sp.]|uniref:hypothetical protein n=1 Tax=Ruegeria sp. TaxID=1879320 RepID=UPI003B5CEE8A